VIGRRKRRERHGRGPFGGPTIGPVPDAGAVSTVAGSIEPHEVLPRHAEPHDAPSSDDAAPEPAPPSTGEAPEQATHDPARAEPESEAAVAGAVEGETGAMGKAQPVVARPSRRRRLFDPRRARNAVTMVGMALLAFVTGLYVFNNVVMPRLVHSVNEQRIPDLTNLTVDQAEESLRDRGLALSRAGERFDPAVPRGFILSQDPPAETPIRGRKRVTVVLSMGEEFSSVPELFGESIRTAQYLLERAGLRLGGVTRAPSEEVGEGLVASTDPPAESVLPRDAPVSLLVSTGGGEERFVMPDVLGREIGGARRQLEAFGLRVSTPPAAPSVGTIVFQDPAPGASITRGTPIVLQATGRIIR
jgi:eukaryotic-like serine/threonine-protein kinase